MTDLEEAKRRLLEKIRNGDKDAVAAAGQVLPLLDISLDEFVDATLTGMERQRGRQPLDED